MLGAPDREGSPTRIVTHGPRMKTATILGACAALAALAACAAPGGNGAHDVEDDVRHGRFEEAVRTASRLREQDPGNVRYEELHRDASVAWLLDHGRRLTFRDRDEEALESFLEAQTIDPESPQAAAWVDKTRRKLSRTWAERGLELHASGRLEEAIEAYERALHHLPGERSAVTGLAEAVIQVNYRLGLGKAYFDEGLRAMAQYRLEQARSRFTYTQKYQPGDERAAARRGQVESLLAGQRLAVAVGLEGLGKFAAARNEYRLALALDPLLVEASEGSERCRDEARASVLLSEAKMEVRRGRLERAQALLDEGEVLTTRQKDLFEGARAGIEQTRLEAVYQRALTLERDFLFEDAVARYDELLGMAEFYKDALARRDTLKEYIRLASELYERAANAASDEERLGELRRIRVFWPEYRDVAEQVQRLERP